MQPLDGSSQKVWPGSSDLSKRLGLRRASCTIASGANIAPPPHRDWYDGAVCRNNVFLLADHARPTSRKPWIFFSHCQEREARGRSQILDLADASPAPVLDFWERWMGKG